MEKKCNDLQKVFQDDSNRLKETLKTLRPMLKKKMLKGRRKVVTFYPRCRVKKTR